MNLTVNHKPIKILGKKIRQNLWNPGLSKKFLEDLIPNIQSIKKKQ